MPNQTRIFILPLMGLGRRLFLFALAFEATTEDPMVLLQRDDASLSLVGNRSRHECPQRQFGGDRLLLPSSVPQWNSNEDGFRRLYPKPHLLPQPGPSTLPTRMRLLPKTQGGEGRQGRTDCNTRNAWLRSACPAQRSKTQTAIHKQNLPSDEVGRRRKEQNSGTDVIGRAVAAHGSLLGRRFHESCGRFLA